jgi:hypothetical protein
MAYLYPIKIGFKSEPFNLAWLFIDLYRIKIELYGRGQRPGAAAQAAVRRACTLCR